MRLFAHIILPLYLLTCVTSCASENRSSNTTDQNNGSTDTSLEPVVPDSGALQQVNPDEIITDDWNDSSPTDLEVD